MLKSHYRYFEGRHVANQVVEGLPLTPREVEALEHFSRDLGAKQIAPLMGVSQSMVEHFAEHVRVKLGCSSMPGCVAKALRQELIK